MKIRENQGLGSTENAAGALKFWIFHFFDSKIEFWTNCGPMFDKFLTQNDFENLEIWDAYVSENALNMLMIRRLLIIQPAYDSA